MRTRLPRVLTAALLALGAFSALTLPASAAVGPGTFTKITTPGGPTRLHFSGATLHFTVSGQTSNDVTSVDIDCIFSATDGSRSVATLAAAVPVISGTFSASAAYSTLIGQCRLRAVPSGVAASTDYLGAYAGPLVYATALIVSLDGSSTKYAFTAATEEGNGIGAAADASCGVLLMATVDTPSLEVRGPAAQQCMFALPTQNITSSGTPTSTAIRVSGHIAYLPQGVHDFLNGSLALGVTQSALAVASTTASNGDLTITESAPLVRCSVSDTYPPTAVSCPNVVSTGVSFKRVANLFRGAHQIRLRDSFTSTDAAAHTVSLQYQGSTHAPPAGIAGYTFPGNGTTFTTITPNQIVTGLGTKAGTILIRSDIYASTDDPAADTLGITWSKAPSSVVFSHDSPSPFSVFAMPYSLAVPAGRSASLGFAESEHLATTDTKALAAVAVGEVVSIPVITSPLTGAVIKGHATTVRGTVALGANGVPTSVTVNGHTATLTVGTTSVSYHVTFKETYARHTITVTARDAAGNVRSRSITVRNVAP